MGDRLAHGLVHVTLLQTLPLRKHKVLRLAGLVVVAVRLDVIGVCRHHPKR
jgi:hypothetical protein